MSDETPPLPSPWTGRLIRALDRLNAWREAARQRRQLWALGERALKDIGIGRSEAYAESIKPC